MTATLSPARRNATPRLAPPCGWIANAASSNPAAKAAEIHTAGAFIPIVPASQAIRCGKSGETNRANVLRESDNVRRSAEARLSPASRPSVRRGPAPASRDRTTDTQSAEAQAAQATRSPQRQAPTAADRAP